jgi:hypothetical protein
VHRRFFLGGSAAGLLSLLAACGGNAEDSTDSLEPTFEPGGHEHIDGVESLPKSTALNVDLLAQPTPGAAFDVSVKLGRQPIAGAAVEVVDIHGTLVDRGTTDADGRFASARDGRKFLVARATVPGVGTLYGFEINTIGKIRPTVDVNLLPTLLQRLNERQPLGDAALDFLLKTFLGIRQDALLSDAEGLAGGFDQEQLRAHFADSGLPLATYLDRIVDLILAALERGLAAPESTEYRRLISSAAIPDACKLLPVYDASWDDDWDDPTWDFVKDLVKAYWPAATKAIVDFSLKKVAEMSGYAFISPVGDVILNFLMPEEPNREMEALNEIQNQLRVLQSAMQAMEQKFAEAEFTRLYDTVRATFNDIDVIITDMADTRAFYQRNGLPMDESFRTLTLRRCDELFAKETALLAAENMYLGLGAFSGAGLLNRWHAIHRQRPFYTAIVQTQYMNLLDYYVSWMNRLYAFIINAYSAHAELTGTPPNVNRVKQLQERLVNQITLIERMRPRYLPSERFVIDVQHGLGWVGRGNVATDFRTFIPADFVDDTYKRRDISNFLQIGFEENNPCRERMLGSPVKDASIREDLANRYAWRLPTKNDLTRSFASRISERYGKKFNLATFRHDFDIPASFPLFNDDGKPARPIIRDNMTVKRTRIARGVYRRYLWLSVFSFSDLGTGSFANHSSYAPLHMFYFPVATLKREEADLFLPWTIYDKAMAEHASKLA